jgi:hypothetical protein
MGQESEGIFPETRLKTESHEKMEINRTEELTLKIERNIAVSFLIPTLVPPPCERRPSFNFFMFSKMFCLLPPDFLCFFLQGARPTELAV